MPVSEKEKELKFLAVKRRYAMAIAMANVLKRLAAGEIALKDLPEGALTEGVKFLKSAREWAEFQIFGSVPSMTADMDDYKVLDEVLKDLRIGIGPNRLNVRQFTKCSTALAILLMSDFLNIVAREGHEITSPERNTIEELAELFARIAVTKEGW